MSKVLIDRSVVEQALEALNASMPHNNDMDEDWPSHIAARRALRAALEQPQVEQEPVAFVRRRVADDFSIRLNRVVTAEDFAGDTKQFLAWCEAHAEREWTPLYTHPQPHRQPLTDEEIRDLFQNQKALPRLKKFIRVIEKAHGIGKQE